MATYRVTVKLVGRDKMTFTKVEQCTLYSGLGLTIKHATEERTMQEMNVKPREVDGEYGKYYPVIESLTIKAEKMPKPKDEK